MHAVYRFAVQVDLPGDGQGFAWMYSIEDPAGDGQFHGCGAQVIFCMSSSSNTFVQANIQSEDIRICAR